MFSTKMKWLLVGLLCLAPWFLACTSANQSNWEQHMRAGITAHRQGQYEEAEKQWIAGLEVAESFGTQDPRYAVSLNNLAELYRAQGRYGDAGPLYKRSLGILEKTLGPEHPNVAQSLENYADLLRKTGRDAEAAGIETRAKIMRTNHPEWTTQ